MTAYRESKSYKSLIRLLETLFLALAGLYFIYRTESATTFRLHWPSWFIPGLKYAMAAVALARLLTAPLKRKETAIAAIMAAIYLLVYLRDGYDFLLFLAILTVGFIDIDYRRILRTCLIAVGVFYCVTVLAGLLGAITNYVRIKNGLRSSWGVCYPTDFASLGLFLLLSLWVSNRKLREWAVLCLCAGYTLVTWRIAHSSTSTVCSLLFICAMLCRMVGGRMTGRHHGADGRKRAVDLLATIAFPLCALGIFGLMLAYARGLTIGYRVNTLLSNRLEYMVNAWRLYGPTPFGTPFVMNGDGFSTFPQPNYTFVDSTYALVVLRYGWVLFLAYCLTWGWTARKAIRCNDRRLVLTLIIIAVHSFAEHHFVEPHFNVLAVMPLAAFPPAGEGEPRPLEGPEGRYARSRVLADAVTALLLAVAFWLAAPAVLSWLKTVLQILHLGNGEHALRLFCVLLAGLCGLCAVLWAVSRILRALFSRAPLGSCRGAIALLLTCAVAGTGAGWFANRIINSAAAPNAAMIEEDREALEIATKAATGKVYAGIMPELYHRSIDGLSYSFFFEDDLARLRGDTALMSADSERGTFFDSGCLYVPISATHALYTGDQAVVEALTAAGYHPTGYYSGELSVDLEEASRCNGLYYGPATGLWLGGAWQGTELGPYVNLYGGRYTATYALRLPAGSPREGSVCTLGISRYKGEELLLEKEVAAEQFGDDGRLEVSIPFTISDSRNVAFLVSPASGRRLIVESIRYVKTPDFDVHTFYNDRMRVVRQENYTLDGEPVNVAGGYFAYDLEYDSWGNVNRIRYYDDHGEPTLCTSGYAELRRTCNAKRQIVREEYFGTDGQPIALTTRFAAIEREYDGAGNGIAVRFYGVDGRPVMVSGGYAQVRRAFDDDGRVVREAYYGIDGMPVALSAGQYAIENEYDDAGNVTVRRFYGEDGALKLRKDGYAEIHWQYNGMHQVVREEYYGTDGELVLMSDGQAANEREYDEAGNVTVYRYYGLDGEPVAVKSGYAELHRRYNDRRKVIREAYFGTDGEPKAVGTGQYAIENEYDRDGNVSVRRFLGADGRPALRTDGYAEVHWQYNNMRKVVREEFYGTDGEPIAVSTGAAADEREYDGAGNVTVYRYFDTKGEATVIVSGYAELHREYNDRRQVVREAYFGTDGAPMAQPEGHCSVMREYDERGNVSVERYYDAYGNPTIIADGYAEVHRTWNSRKQKVREAYFDETGAPMVRAAGHSAIEQEFDDDGKLSVRRYLDAEGKQMLRVDGYAEARWAYDAEGVRNVAFFDLEGNVVPTEGLNLVLDAPDGWSRWYTLETNKRATGFKLAEMNLGKKKAGDAYSCRVEIEFSNVTATEGRDFRFQAQGSIDGSSDRINIWNDALIKLTSPPGDGVCSFGSTQELDESSAASDVFNLGFRYDYWASGSFRVRCVKVEKGAGSSEWKPGI